MTDQVPQATSQALMQEMGLNDAAIVTGLSSEVAQSLVALGIELTSLNTVGDLQGGVEEAEPILGYRVVLEDPGLAPLGMG